MPWVIESASHQARDTASFFPLLDEYKDFFQSKLLKYGAILFRNFKIETIEEFHSFVCNFSEKDSFSYAGECHPASAWVMPLHFYGVSCKSHAEFA
jgi:hypothetical protein